MTRVLRRDGIFPPEGAPEPPAKGRRSAGALQKRGLRDILKATAAAHRADKRQHRIQAVGDQDEARVGNKGGCVTRWWRSRASVPPGRVKSARQLGLHLRGRRAPGHRRRRHPGDGPASGRGQGHGPVSSHTSPIVGPGCARRADHRRRRRLARKEARPQTSPQRHGCRKLLPPGQSRTRPRRAGCKALPPRTLPLFIPGRPRRHARHYHEAPGHAWIDLIAETGCMRTGCAQNRWIMGDFHRLPL